MRNVGGYPTFCKNKLHFIRGGGGGHKILDFLGWGCCCSSVQVGHRRIKLFFLGFFFGGGGGIDTSSTPSPPPYGTSHYLWAGGA